MQIPVHDAEDETCTPAVLDSSPPRSFPQAPAAPALLSSGSLPDVGATQLPAEGTSNVLTETGQRQSSFASESPSETAVNTDPGPSIAVQDSTVQDILRARGFPYSDGQRIALLFASLGITDETYLRMFARLPARYREVWLSEMCEKRLLTDIQSWVISDMLDALAAD